MVVDFLCVFGLLLEEIGNVCINVVEGLLKFYEKQKRNG
jgi:hypothetical protein